MGGGGHTPRRLATGTWFFSCCSRVFFFSSSLPSLVPPGLSPPRHHLPSTGRGSVDMHTERARARSAPGGGHGAGASVPTLDKGDCSSLSSFFICVSWESSLGEGGGCRPKGASFKNWIDGLVDAQRWKFVVKGDEFVLAPVRRRCEGGRYEKGCIRALVQGEMRHTLLMACFAFGLGGCW